MSKSLIDPKVELEFLASILQRRRPELYRVIPLLEPTVFSNEPYQWLARQLRTYFRQYKRPPSQHAVEVWINEAFEDDEHKRYSNLLALFDHALSFDEHASELFLNYVSARVYIEKSREAVQAYQRSKDIKLLLRDAKEAVSAGVSVQVQRPVLDYADGWDRREDNRKVRRDNPLLYKNFRMGIAEIDQQVPWAQGTLAGFLGPFKRYKSVVLNHMAFAGLLQGLNVALIIFENTIALTEARLDSRFTGVSQKRLEQYLKTKDEKETADTLLKRVGNWRQRVKIIKAKPNETTVADVEADLLALRLGEGFDPDLTIWDYANLIAPSGRHREERLQQTQVVWDLLAHAQDSLRPRLVVTAFQAKMEGAKAERLDVTHFGKTIGIIQGLDVAIAINQTEDERQDGAIVFSPLVIRNGYISQPHCGVLSHIDRMCIAEETDDLWKEVEHDKYAWSFQAEAAAAASS